MGTLTYCCGDDSILSEISDNLLVFTSNKWRGSVRVPVPAPVETIWDITGEFCGLQKWISSIEACERVEGEEKVPGCVRYCRGMSSPRSSKEKSWVKEKLLAFDSENHSYTYTVIEGNQSLEEYVATFQVFDCGKEDAMVEWSFELNPVIGFTEEEFITRMSSVMGAKIRSLEKQLLPHLNLPPLEFANGCLQETVQPFTPPTSPPLEFANGCLQETVQLRISYPS